MGLFKDIDKKQVKKPKKKKKPYYNIYEYVKRHRAGKTKPGKSTNFFKWLKEDGKILKDKK